MNTTSASPVKTSADSAGSTAQTRKALVWDVPVRLFHWLIVLCFTGAYLTAESEQWRLLHVTLGYTMAGLVLFRIVWGLIGTRYARFSEFVRGPGAAIRYLGGLLRRRPEHYLGHNPAGALAIVALLLLALAVTGSGWALYNEIGGDVLEEVHEFFANTMLALVFIHIAAVVLSSWLHHENLIGAMFTGYKKGAPEQGTRHAWRSVAALMLAAVLGFWWLQWHSAPAATDLRQSAVVEKATAHGHSKDGDG